MERALETGELPCIIRGDVGGQVSDSPNIPEGQRSAIYRFHRKPWTSPQDGKVYEFCQENIASHYFRAIRRVPFTDGMAMYGYAGVASASASSAQPPRRDSGESRTLLLPLTDVSTPGQKPPQNRAGPSSSATTGSGEPLGLKIYGLPANVNSARDGVIKALAAAQKKSLRTFDVPISPTDPWDAILLRLQVAVPRAVPGAEVLDVKDDGGKDATTRKVSVQALGELSLITAEGAVVDFINSLKIEKLQRELSENSIVFPAEWEGTSFDPATPGVEMKDVAPGTAEWKTVEDQFKSGRFASQFNKKLVKVERVQNPAAWTTYLVHLKGMASKLPGAGDVFTKGNERWMKHGTRDIDPRVIAAHTYGLDYRYSSAQCMYGQAAYTAEDAMYSHGYR